MAESSISPAEQSGSFPREKHVDTPPLAERPGEQVPPSFEQATEAPREGTRIEQSGEPPQATAPAPLPPADDDHQRLLMLAKKEQLDELTRIAFDEGIAKAVAIAKKLENPYLLDEFHDSLMDELHQHLVSEGKLEEI